MFIKMLGARHTIESAMDIPPAARRRKSMNAQVAINPLDTIVIAGCQESRLSKARFLQPKVLEWVALTERLLKALTKVF